MTLIEEFKKARAEGLLTEAVDYPKMRSTVDDAIKVLSDYYKANQSTLNHTEETYMDDAIESLKRVQNIFKQRGKR